ncbi:MAG: ImuA family protein [Rhodothalassiaceae bacterium]
MSRNPPDSAPAGRTARLAALRAMLNAGAGAGTAASPVAVQARSLSLGVPVIDRGLANLPAAAVHELVPASGGDIAAATGFLLALALALKREDATADRPILWLTRRGALHEAGALSGRGLADLGVDPGHLLLAATRRDEDVLWALEEAARAGAVAVAVGEIAEAGLKATQRLALAARAQGCPVLLLRAARGLSPSAARSRWRIAAAPSARLRLAPHVPGRARWRVVLEKGWRARPGDWILEWDDATHSLRLAAALADRPIPAGTAEDGRATA